MRNLMFLVLALTAGIPVLPAQDFTRADTIPIPEWGVVRFDGSGYEHYGYSASRGAILFLREGSTEGIGGNPDIDYILIDPTSGEIVQEIPVSFNMYAIADPSDEEEWDELLRRNQEMAEAAESEVAMIWDLDDGSYTDSLHGMGGIVRCINPEADELGFNYVYRYYAANDATGWLKPIHESGEYTSNPEAVDFRRAYLTGGGTMLMLQFFRFPIMEFDTGTQIFLVLSREETAQFFNEVGFAHYGRKDYRAALVTFDLALAAFPDYTKSAYNAACSAALLRDVEGSLRYLGELARIRDERVDDYAVAAERSLLAVDKDTDFNAIRTNTTFVSGLRRIRSR